MGNVKSLYLILLIFFIVYAIWSLYSFYFETEMNRCSMTYMFEMPRYYKLSLDSSVRRKFKNYNLYYYTEGYRTVPQIFSGIPVLFIPGNAGSYKQVRSMGSIALRMSEESQYSHTFDYFSVDFDEELGAFSGKYLITQTNFVAKCIKYILSLYDSLEEDRSVLIIAHSMGGIVARKLFMLPDFKSSSVHTIITLATPHIAPVVGFDKELIETYNSLNRYWSAHYNSSLRHITVVSLVGGSRDIQVWDGYGDMRPFISPDRLLWISSTGVTRVWASSDHLCIIWCKELCLNLNRALYQTIDGKSGALSTNPDFRMKNFHQHLVSPYVHDSINNGTFRDSQIENVKWKYYKKSSAVFSRRHISNSMYLHFGRVSRNDSKLFFSASGVKENWIFICVLLSGSDNKNCSKLIDISPLATRLPPRASQRKMIILNASQILSIGHAVVVKVDRSDNNVEVLYEELDPDERFLSESVGWIGGRMSATVAVTKPGSLFYRIILPDFTEITRPARVSVHCLTCKQDSALKGMITFTAPWNRDFGYENIGSQIGQNSQLRLQLSRNIPLNRSVDSAYIDVYLNPHCQYSIHVYLSPIDMAVQIFRMNISFLPLFFLCHLLYFLANQLESFLYRDCMNNKIEPIRYGLLHNVAVLVPISFCCYIASYVEGSDWHYFVNHELTDVTGMILLPILSFALLWLAAVVMDICVFICSVPVRRFCYSDGTATFPLYLFSFLVCLCISISLLTCDGLGTASLLLPLFIHMCINRTITDSRLYNIFSCMFLLVCLLVMFKTSDIVTFVKNQSRMSNFYRSIFKLLFKHPKFDIFPQCCLPSSISLFVSVWFMPNRKSLNLGQSKQSNLVHLIPWIIRLAIGVSIFMAGTNVHILSCLLVGVLAATALLIKLHSQQFLSATTTPNTPNNNKKII